MAVRSRESRRRVGTFLAAAALAWAAGCGGGGEAAIGDHEEPQSAEGEGEVHLTADEIARFGIRIEPLPSSSGSIMRRPATLQLDPDRVALVGPRIRAKVERVLVDLGDFVREVTPLAVLSSVELGTAKAAYQIDSGGLPAGHIAMRQRELQSSLSPAVAASLPVCPTKPPGGLRAGGPGSSGCLLE